MWRRGVIAGLVVLAVGTGCSGDGDEVRAGGEPAPGGELPIGDAVDGPVHGTLAVLEDTEHGPQLCTSMQESEPPQCGGPDVVGWSWDDVDGEESALGTTWGTYEVVGAWDGERLTLTEPPAPPRHGDVTDVDFTSPCPEPEGGWRPVDPATTTDDALRAAQARAERRDDHAGLWVDQSINPASAAGVDAAEAEAAMNDPTKLVLNVRVTGDVAATEAALREVWGGALCVSSAEHTLDELGAIQTEIGDELAAGDNLLSTGQDVTRGVVEVTVFVDAGLQAALDDRYGDGVVEVTATLQPVG